MKNRVFLVGMLALVLVFGFGLAGCTTWDGAVYSPPPQSSFNQGNVAKGEFFFINSAYASSSNNIEGLCFLVNLGTFEPEPNVTSYEMSFAETGISEEKIITLYTSVVQNREIIVLPVKAYPLTLLKNRRVTATNSIDGLVPGGLVTGGYYYIYKWEGDKNNPDISPLSDEGSLQWGGQEIPKSEILEGVKAAVALEYGWHVEEAQSAPSTDTLEKRSASSRDHERSAISRYISRAGNLKSDTWYVFTNDARPGETFYAYSKKGFLSFWEYYREIK